MEIRKSIARSISKIDTPENFGIYKWLRVPKNSSKSIGRIYVEIEDRYPIDLDPEEPAIIFTAFFTKGISKGKVTYSYFVKPNTIPRFFEFAKEKTLLIEFDLPKAEYRNLNKFIYSPDKVSVSKNDYLIGTPAVSDQLYKFLLDRPEISEKLEEFITEIPLVYNLSQFTIPAETKNVKLLTPEVNTTQYNSEFEIPATTEHTSQFIPEVRKIDILNPADFLSESHLINNADHDLNLDLSLPPSHKIDSLTLTNDYPMMLYDDFEIKNGGVRSMNHLDIAAAGEGASPDNLIEDLVEHPERKSFIRYLEPVFEIPEEFKQEVYSNLPRYQSEGAEFLLNSDFALLYDEFELDKGLQAAAALNILLRVRAVKKVLIITSSYTANLKEIYDENKSLGYWENKLMNLIPEFHFNFIHSANEMRKSAKANSHILNGTTYQVIEESFLRGVISPEQLNQYDCLIFDDITPEFLDLNALEAVKQNLVSNYIWLLSDLKGTKFIEKIKFLFPDKKLNTFGRDRAEVYSELQGRKSYNYFIKMDEENKNDSKRIIESGIDNILSLLDYGNLFRFQPNAFKILQDTQQVTNFVNGQVKGNKVELLKYNLRKVLNRNDRVLVYSQFDRYGLSRIEEVLNQMKLEYIKFNFNEAAKDIQPKLSRAKNEQGKIVYLTNIKPKAITFKFPNVSHLINFDNWWNPITRWTLESTLEANGNNISIYNYYFKDSYEASLVRKLASKGLNDKNVLEVIKPENFYKIFNDSDWSEFLKIKNELIPEKEKVELEMNTMDDLVDYAKILLRLIGYENFAVSYKSKEEVTVISGSQQLNGEVKDVITYCVLSEKAEPDLIKKIINKNKSSAAKIFVITNGTISYFSPNIPDNISFIDGGKLNLYLENVVNH